MGTATGVDLTDLDNFVHYGPMLICRGSLNSWDAAFRTIVRRRSPLEIRGRGLSCGPTANEVGGAKGRPHQSPLREVVCVRYGSFKWV
jgi:hypothetical protein